MRGTSTIERWLGWHSPQRTTFRHELAVCAIFKDEAPFLDEWLTFHAGVGVEHFYLYDDASSDSFRDVLAPWIHRGLVTLIDWADRNQPSAYNHCLRHFRRQNRWMAFIDIDEFLFSPRHFDLRRALQDYADVPALFVYWVLFGSAGHQTRPAAPVLETYTRCLPPAAAVMDAFEQSNGRGKAEYVTGWARDGKSIVNPRMVRKYAAHKPKALWSGRTLDENRQAPRHLQRLLEQCGRQHDGNDGPDVILAYSGRNDRDAEGTHQIAAIVPSARLLPDVRFKDHALLYQLHRQRELPGFLARELLEPCVHHREARCFA